MNELEQQARYVESGWESLLTISVDASLPFSILTPLIDEFYQQHRTPSCSSVRTYWLAAGKRCTMAKRTLSLARFRNPPRAKIVCQPLGWLEYVFAVAPDHPLAAEPEPLLREQIRQYRAVTVHDSSRHGAGMDLRVLDEQKTLSVHDFPAKLQAHLAGLGCGYLPLYWRARTASGALVARQLDSECRRDIAYLAWNESACGNAAIWWRERLPTLPGLSDIYAPA